MTDLLTFARQLRAAYSRETSEPGVCGIPDCARPVRARGLCDPCYRRAIRNGLLTKRSKDPADLFFQKVDRTSECWIWTGCTDHHGYGQLRRNGKHLGAHRVSWEMVNGPIPKGFSLDHICHNPPCVNPDHLRLATHQENMRHRNRPTGVYWASREQRWLVKLSANGVIYCGGSYANRADAETAADELRERISGQFKSPNYSEAS